MFDNKLSGTMWIADVTLTPLRRRRVDPATEIGTPMKLVRAGLCALFVITVLAYGAVEVWSQAVLEVGADFYLWCGR